MSTENLSPSDMIVYWQNDLFEYKFGPTALSLLNLHITPSI